MKLLGWMHSKFRQSSGDLFKDFATGQSCNCNCLSGRPSHDEPHHHPYNARLTKPLRPMRDQRLFAEEEEFLAEDDEFFEGLLTIGTLGSGPIEALGPTGTTTPTFGGDPVHVDTIAEKHSEATTETDLQLINAELEKLLVVAETDKNDRMSSARPSHVSSKADSTCPLQGYLFGSPIEMAETTESTAVMQRREHRISLGELFMKTREAEEGGEGKREERAVEEEEGRSTVGMRLMMMKKMLKRRGSSSSSSRGTRGGSGDTSAVETTKLHKILQIFHRKIHPESTMSTKKYSKSSKYEMNNSVPSDGDSDSSAQGETMIASERAYKKEGIRSFKCHSNPTSSGVGGSESNGNREYWIKTDADYLVLEL